MKAGCLPLILFLIFLALLPLVFGQLFTTALMKLRLEPSTAILLVMGIILGSSINLPLKRIPRNDVLVQDPLAILSLTGRWPWLRRVQQETVIAVNVGGCLIPAGLAIYEVAHLSFDNPQSLPWLAIAVAVNTAVCYRLAQPVSGIGIALPGLVPRTSLESAGQAKGARLKARGHSHDSELKSSPLAFGRVSLARTLTIAAEVPMSEYCRLGQLDRSHAIAKQNLAAEGSALGLHCSL